MIQLTKPLTTAQRKFIKSLNSRKNRLEHRLFAVEGLKMCRELLDSTFEIDSVLVSSSADKSIRDLLPRYFKRNIPIYSTNEEEFSKVSDTKTPQGILATVKIKEDKFHKNRPFLALDNISDPGNVGTIIRTADWFGFKNIVLGGNSADRYSPKVIRATMGSIFRCNIVHEPNLFEFIAGISEEYEIYGAVLNGKLQLKNCIPNIKFGIVFGSESHGISEEIQRIISQKFTIPGSGRAESLNVAVSAGITLNHFFQSSTSH